MGRGFCPWRGRTLCVLTAPSKACTHPKELSYVLDKVQLEDIQGNKYQVRGFLRALQVIKLQVDFTYQRLHLLLADPFSSYCHIPSRG